MLVKDKDILVQDQVEEPKEGAKKRKPIVRINKKNMSSAWGDAFDAYLRGITEYYLQFHNRSTRIEFWGYMTAAGIVWLPIYLLGQYVEMPMLPYYYALATLIPTVAITARRLHDTSKNAMLYLGILPLLGLTGLFIGWYALILVAVYLVILMRLLFVETDETEGFFGPAKENDETYGDDNIRILKKFRMLTVCLALICGVITYSSFDDWSRQSQQKGIRSMIDDEMQRFAVQNNLTPEQMENARSMMNEMLKQMQGQQIQEEDLLKQVDTLMQGLIKGSAQK